MFEITVVVRHLFGQMCSKISGVLRLSRWGSHRWTGLYVTTCTVALIHLHCLLFGVLGWVSVQHFEISAYVRVRVRVRVRPVTTEPGREPRTLMAQLALQYSALNHCATREAVSDNL